MQTELSADFIDDTQNVLRQIESITMNEGLLHESLKQVTIVCSPNPRQRSI